jgi:hypothetical protein
VTGTVTRIHDVVDALVDLIEAAAPDLQVADGPVIGEILSEAICVGFTEGADSPGYSTEYVRQDGMGRVRYQEAWSVRCFLTISSGDTDMRALRARGADILGLIAAALADRTRDEAAWDRAVLSGSADWVPVITDQGGLVNVFFSVEGASLL